MTISRRIRYLYRAFCPLWIARFWRWCFWKFPRLINWYCSYPDNPVDNPVECSFVNGCFCLQKKGFPNIDQCQTDSLAMRWGERNFPSSLWLWRLPFGNPVMSWAAECQRPVAWREKWYKRRSNHRLSHRSILQHQSPKSHKKSLNSIEVCSQAKRWASLNKKSKHTMCLLAAPQFKQNF